jgi:esterase FrsA
LPSLFYFSISGPDSLCLDPFNQPVEFLQGEMIRVFSLTLPGHEEGLLAKDAMKLWAAAMEKGQNSVAEFLDHAERAIEFAIAEQFIDASKLGAAGLSRGAFMAAHLAARDERFRHILGFAPLTKLCYIREFHHLLDHPIPKGLDLIHLADKLGDRHIKLYIGNEDTQVGTRECFDFFEALVSKKKQRASYAELLIYPSIGRMGHGTPPEIFKQGALWLLQNLKN